MNADTKKSVLSKISCGLCVLRASTGLSFEPGMVTDAPLLIDLPACFYARVTNAVHRR